LEEKRLGNSEKEIAVSNIIPASPGEHVLVFTYNSLGKNPCYLEIPVKAWRIIESNDWRPAHVEPILAVTVGRLLHVAIPVPGAPGRYFDQGGGTSWPLAQVIERAQLMKRIEDEGREESRLRAVT